MTQQDRYSALLEFLESEEADLSDVSGLGLLQVTRNKIGTRIVCLFANALPAELPIDRALLYLVFVLDQVVTEPFHIVYFNAPAQRRFSMGWLWQSHSMLPDKYHSNLQRLYFVHPTPATKAGLKMIAPFIQKDAIQKLLWVDTIPELLNLIGCPDLPLPTMVGSTPMRPLPELPLNTPRPSQQFGSAERQLLVASTLGEVGKVRSVLDAKVNLDVRDGCGCTAAMLAARAGQQEIVDLLVEHGADLLAINFEGVSAVQLASRHGHTNIVGSLIAAGAKASEAGGTESALSAAASTGRVDVVATLLKLGSSVKERGEALMRACSYGDAQVVKQLLGSRTTNTHRGNALVKAAAFGHADIVGMLLESGADCNHVDTTGHTGLMRACTLGHNQVVGMLLMAHADLELTNKNKSSALHLATLLNNKPAVVQLLEARAGVDSGDEYQMTALMMAAESGFSEIVRSLVESLGDVNRTDDHGITPLMLASSFGHSQVAELLVEKGADKEAVDCEGRTAGMLAELHRQACA
eukprot:TRINITY_DN19987_c0_g1_i2.p1 TRINITY_DN19987_c0_g1~~TRINITY_DN19987_c0_g1_i2.p1  ORF type:complete len:524 (-),score=157.41 TRINITY_DN19987_c0_g1_i2:439-2010(-)